MIALAFGVAARYKLLLLYSHFFTKSSFIFSGKHVQYCLKKSEMMPSLLREVGY
jgi:hypothetical protein